MNVYDFADYFQLDSSNPWKGTPLEDYYALNPASKGNKAEEIVSKILTSLFYEVKPRLNPGHDRIINDVKTEIKFATAVNRNNQWQCIFNHIGFEKDWDQILLVCVNGDCEIRGVVFTKENFPKDLLSHQQGGASSVNDDYMINSGHSEELLFYRGGQLII